MARIAAIVTNGCDPDPRVIREGRWLVESGHDVIIHAFDRNQNLPLNEEINGVSIQRHRVGGTPYGGTFSTWNGIRRFLQKVRPELGNVDLIHCHDADTLPVVNSFKGKKILFDMHDLQHTWVRMSAPKSLLRKAVSSRMKMKMLARAKKVNAIITSSQGFTNWLNQRDIKSTPIENRPTNADHPKFPVNRAIGYFGKIREISSFKLLFEAVKSLPENQQPAIILAGDGTKESDIQSLAKQYPSLQIEFIGKFSHNDLPSLMSRINLMFAMYSPERGNINAGALPSKMFEAAAHGRPSIVNRNTPMGKQCESENLGLSVDWNDIQGLASAITELTGIEVHLEIDEERERTRFLKVIDDLRI